jgi:hypothetical protein
MKIISRFYKEYIFPFKFSFSLVFLIVIHKFSNGMEINGALRDAVGFGGNLWSKVVNEMVDFEVFF